jgi:asparagine synthetase B (glutamine-hydrolysing)
VCGICGEVRFDGAQPSALAITRMMEAIAPRGPDGLGLEMHNTVALAHRRLSIIDLSVKARQPLVRKLFRALQLGNLRQTRAVFQARQVLGTAADAQEDIVAAHANADRERHFLHMLDQRVEFLLPLPAVGLQELGAKEPVPAPPAYSCDGVVIPADSFYVRPSG